MIDKEYCEKLRARAFIDVVATLGNYYADGDLVGALDALKVKRSDASVAMNRAAIDYLFESVMYITTGLDDRDKLYEEWKKIRSDAKGGGAGHLEMDGIAKVVVRQMMSKIAEEDLQDVISEYRIVG